MAQELKKKKKSLADRARGALAKYLPSKKPTKDFTMSVADERSKFPGTTGVTISKMNRRRKALEESLKY